MNKNTAYRIVADIAVLICIIHGWWFIALPISLLASWLCPYYIEIIIAGLAYDAMFGSFPETGLWGYAGTISSIMIALFIAGAKRVVRK